MHYIKTIPLVIALGISHLSLASHQTEAFFTEEDMLGELPMVSSASRMDQTMNRVPASVSIIDRDMIVASGAITWVDVFRLVPGFQAYYINGNRYGIGYHGFGEEFPNHLEVMINGRSIYEPAFSGIEWSSLGITLDEVDHIEVVRGSNAPAYGSNAFMGAINIVTLKPQQESGLHQRFTVGDRQTREGHIRYSAHHQKLDYRVSVNYQHNEGFPAVSSGDSPGPMEDGKESIGFNIRGMYTPNIANTFDLEAGFNHNNSGWGDVDHPDEYTRVNFKSQYQSLKWRHELNTTDDLKLHYYHNKLEGDNFVNQGLLSDLLTEELNIPIGPDDVKPFLQAAFSDPTLDIEDQYFITGFLHTESERHDLELEHHLKLSDKLRATWGAGLRYDRVEGQTIFGHNDDETLTSRRLFGNLEWRPFQHWTFNAGLMLEDNSLVDTIGSGRIAANYHINPHHTLRFSYAQGKRSPTLVEAKEFNADIIDNQILVSAIRRSDPNLKEERLKSFEVGYLAQYPHQGLTLDVRLFREEVRDAFEVYQQLADIGLHNFNPGDNFSVRNNIAESDMTGAELQLRYQPDNKTLLTAHYGYRDVDSSYPTRFEPELHVGDLNHDGPRHTAGLLIEQKLTRQVAASMNVYHITDADWRDGNATDQFVRIDAQLRFGFSVGKTKGNIMLIGQNLGEDYMEHGENNVFESRFYLKVTLDLP
jgi:iron complex outermembrane receptor protein